jgi:hypothetical protein
MLVSVSDADVEDLVALVRHCAPAIALVQRTVGVQARERLQAAGWRCVELSGADDLADAWNDVSGE